MSFWDFDKDPNSTANTAATSAEALSGTETGKYVSPAALRYAVDAITNPRATQGALAFDGTASSRVYSTLTNQNIGTDPFSVVFKVEVPASNPSVARPLGCFSSSSTTSAAAAALTVFVNTSGGLDIYLFGATTSDFNRAVVSGIVSAWGGKTVIVCLSRATSGNLAVYVNGAVQSPTYSTGGTAPTWQGSVTSTYFGVGYDSASQVFVGKIYSATLYNLALSQADVTEIQELGGGVPFRYQFGSQAGYNSDFSAGVDTWAAGDANQTIAGNQDAINGSNDWLKLEATGTATPLYIYPTGSGALNAAMIRGTAGKCLRLRSTVFNPSGSAITHFGHYIQGSAVYAGASQAISANSEATFSDIITNTGSVVLGRLGVRGGSGSPTGSNAAGQLYYVKNVSVAQVGAVAHYDADLGGVGLQLPDQGANKLHALLTTTGVTWTKPATMGYVRALSDGTTAAQQLGGGTILPANCQIVRVRARSISGTPSITLGTSSGGSQIVASVALSTTWKDLTIALSGGINTANNALWMTASAANVVEVQLAYEQLPA